MKKLLLKKIDNLVSAALAVIGALLFGQFPQFIAQYIQRLGGHLDEARLIQQKYSDYTSGELPERIEYLEESLSAIQNAGPIEKFFSFIFNVDTDIAAAAWQNYTPGITFDTTGFIYIVFGALLLYLLKELLFLLASLPFRKKAEKQT